MALDLSSDGLNARIEALRVGFAGHQSTTLARNRTLLRAFSPEYNADLREFDQFKDPITDADKGHFRSSYNLTRPVVEMWSALEMGEFPAVRWQERYLPTPVPSMDPMQNARNQEAYRMAKQLGRSQATIREQMLEQHIRRSKLPRHTFRAVTKKNLYGNSWLKTFPDRNRRTFTVVSRGLDTATIFPVRSVEAENRLDAILVAYKRSAQSVNAQYPGIFRMGRDGITLDSSDTYYQTTAAERTDADRRFVWVEDYWALDAEWTEDVTDAPPIRSRVVNGIRVNGKLVDRIEYPGWRSVPYVPFESHNERDHWGFSDAGTMLPIQDSLNSFMSQQQDVIAGESRPKFKYRGDADRIIDLGDESVISLDPDEDIEQIAVRLDVFPTQVHGQQLMEALGRATGLPDVAWGRIVAAQNSGRALATAWRAVAARMVPRLHDDSDAIEPLLSMWLDWMELYGWDSAGELYNGNRDFELDYPNQEPRDFTEVALAAVNKLNAGLLDIQGAMEETGQRSPDEMMERVRADYMDPVYHPEKRQSMLLLDRLAQQIVIEGQQAGLAIAQAKAELTGGGTVDQQAGSAAQARNQAQAQAAPQLAEGQNGAAAAPGQAGGSQRDTRFSTLAQDGGPAMNRIIDQGRI